MQFVSECPAEPGQSESNSCIFFVSQRGSVDAQTGGFQAWTGNDTMQPSHMKTPNSSNNILSFLTSTIQTTRRLLTYVVETTALCSKYSCQAGLGCTPVYTPWKEKNKERPSDSWKSFLFERFLIKLDDTHSFPKHIFKKIKKSFMMLSQHTLTPNPTKHR